MPTPAPEGGDLLDLDKVYQEVEPALTPNLKKTFKPWHKPRKQHIRVHLWGEAIRALIKANGLTAGDVLHYLGMPGEDFLDLRSLDTVCRNAKIKVRYLGLDSTAGAAEFETNISNYEVAQL